VPNVRWEIESWDKKGRKGILIYEGVVREKEGRERVRFHFTIRDDLLIGDFQSETVGVYEFLSYISADLGEPEREPYAIFLGEFGDGEAAIPVTVWWKKGRDESCAWVESFIKNHAPEKKHGEN